MLHYFLHNQSARQRLVQLAMACALFCTTAENLHLTLLAEAFMVLGVVLIITMVVVYFERSRRGLD